MVIMVGAVSLSVKRINMFNFISEQFITVLITLLVTALTTIGGVYIKKIDTKLKRKTLRDEINRYSDWVRTVDEFKNMTEDEQVDTIFDTARTFAYDNDISVSDSELRLMVKTSLSSISRLQMTGLKLMVNKKENNDGIIEK